MNVPDWVKNIKTGSIIAVGKDVDQRFSSNDHGISCCTLIVICTSYASVKNDNENTEQVIVTCLNKNQLINIRIVNHDSGIYIFVPIACGKSYCYTYGGQVNFVSDKLIRVEY